MPASLKQLNKVGFSPRQAELIHKLWDDSAEPTLEQAIAAGFPKRKAEALLSGAPSPDGGVTPATLPSKRDLLVLGGFTRHQADLILKA